MCPSQTIVPYVNIPISLSVVKSYPNQQTQDVCSIQSRANIRENAEHVLLNSYYKIKQYNYEPLVLYPHELLIYAWERLVAAHNPWKWFFTGTFREDLTEERALLLWRRWLGILCTALQDSSTDRVKPRVKYILAVEHTHIGRVHLHAAIDAIGTAGTQLQAFRRIRWMHSWERIAGGMSRIYPTRSQLRGYLVKEVTKGGHLIVGGNAWQGRNYRLPTAGSGDRTVVTCNS